MSSFHPHIHTSISKINQISVNKDDSNNHIANIKTYINVKYITSGVKINPYWIDSFAGYLYVRTFSLVRMSLANNAVNITGRLSMLVFWVLKPCSEHGGKMFIRNAGIYLQVHAALQCRRPKPKSSQSWERQISFKWKVTGQNTWLFHEQT
jgi:hypothetical protein